LALLVLVLLLLLVVLAADLAVVMVGLAVPANKALLAAIHIRAALAVVVVVAKIRLMRLKQAALVALQTCALVERREQLVLRAALAWMALVAVALVAVVVVVFWVALALRVVLAGKMAAVVEAAVLRSQPAVLAAMAATALFACIAGKETHP
jgi:hypothetical protein